jgi:archaellum biogenesis ATPase FlaH
MRTQREEFKHDYNIDLQVYLLRFLISDPDIFARCRAIISDEYFDDQLAPAVRFILQHADEYRVLPMPELIEAKTGRLIERLPPEEIVRQRDAFMSEIEKFCRHRAVENVILDGVDLLRDGRMDVVYERIKEAVTISLVSDLGTDYFKEPEERLRRMLDKSSFVSTGWQILDTKLYGGFSRGGLNVFAGESGSGKSLVLQNLALNWALAGHVVVYFSLELGEDFVSLRLDAMLTERSTKEVCSKVDEAAILVTRKGKTASRLFVKKMPEGSTTTNELRAYLKEFEIKTGLKPDAVIVDYLDLMYPNNTRVKPSDLFVKDKYVSEELRGLYFETNTFGATASQLNRAATKAQGEFDHSHIAGGISKINTADNVIAIWAPRKERGEYDMLFMKTRSSSAVGHKITLHYDPDCMRITDRNLTKEPERPRSYADIKEELAERNKSEALDPAGVFELMKGERMQG